ncbi:MAG: D-alanyl-D-alanine dipeptidase [Chloroherpetonaceae bacterium]|nr:D-alanyl-D-alanine dipeptidase [Chloroherpetonaceae bacterium]MCS7211499.1 D-alanyl-D-alanine dipeptidase [Chloroherpetonaceae bacterium]MDW8020136.1 D-alanyl-D-alanine dipeptidase [Chloroherpetonaceae bacterium]
MQLLLMTLTANAAVAQALKPKHDLVDVQKINPRILIEMRYATANNFMKKAVYKSARCLLQRSVAERLSRVQERLEKLGYGLKIYDAYRPLSAQWELWKVVPNPTFVADPRKGSKHNRGAAVDLTLVDREGNEVEMPTEYDAFVKEARSDYMDLPPHILRHRQILHDAMKAEGFLPNPSEWWHFDDPDWHTYPILDIDFDEIP